MARPEGLFIPEIQPRHIVHAEQLRDPFAVIVDEQELVASYIIDHIGDLKALIQGPFQADLDVGMAQRVSGITYNAMRYAYHFPLPRVQSKAKDAYLATIEHKDMPGQVDLWRAQDKVALLRDQQPAIPSHFKRRFTPDWHMVATSCWCSAIIYQLVEMQFALASKPGD